MAPSRMRATEHPREMRWRPRPNGEVVALTRELCPWTLLPNFADWLSGRGRRFIAHRLPGSETAPASDIGQPHPRHTSTRRLRAVE